MPRAAVLGRPIGHSRSPRLHRAAYDALGLSGWTYEAVECDEAALPAFLGGLDDDWVGLSLTMPLKRVVLSHVDTSSELARRVGAANTVLLSREARHADNTDVGGMVDALGDVDVSRPVILGAGGTAAAALAALRSLGALTVTTVVRQPDRAGELLGAAARIGMDVRLESWPTLPDASVVVSTVPRGAADALGELPWGSGTTVLDVVYDPWPTGLARAAAAGGCRVVSGLDLLLHQAARQVTLMTGLPAPVQAMRDALR